MLFSNKKTKSKKFFILKTAFITTMAASVIAFSNGPVAFATSSKLTTIYHVYLNGTYIGNITDKNIIDNLVAEKEDSAMKSFKNVNFKVSQQVQYIPEQVFQSSANNQETIQNINNAFQIQAEADAIVIDGTPVVYLENQEAAEQVIKNLKLKRVTEKQLAEIEARKAAINPVLPPLKENQTRLLDVRLSKNVSVEAKNIFPDQIMSVADAVTFLQKGTLEDKKYAIKKGDVLESIADDHGLKMADILKLNPGLTEETLLKIGQEINITVPKAYVEVVVDKEVNKKESISYQTEVVENSSMPKGETKEKQKGQNGSRSVTYTISEQDGVTVKKDKANEKILKQPVKHIVIKGTKVIPSRGEGSFTWPTSGGYVSSQMGYRWGRMHKGIDIARPSDGTIKAADNGIVVSAGWDNGGYGNKVVIDHQNGFQTLYGHMSSINVSAGQVISKGSSIGVMGATGDATGVHLHFEVYKNGGLVNPLAYLR